MAKNRADNKGFYVFADCFRFLIDNAPSNELGDVFRGVYRYIIDGVDYNEIETDIMTKQAIYSILKDLNRQENIKKARADAGRAGGKATQDSNRSASYDLDAFKKQALEDDLHYEPKKKND